MLDPSPPEADAPEPPVAAPAPAAPTTDAAAADDAARPAAPTPVSAADRVQSRPTSTVPLTPAASRRSYWRVVRVVALVAVLAAVAVWFSRRGVAADDDLLGRLAGLSAEFQPDLVTADPQQVARYIEDASGWVVDVPALPQLQVVGVGFVDLTEAASVPAIRFDGRDAESVVVYAYDYVFLDALVNQLDLPEAVYARLAEDPGLDVRRVSGDYAVSWRDRAVVYTAVTSEEAIAERLADQIRP